MSKPKNVGLGKLEEYAADKKREAWLAELRSMHSYVVRSGKQVLEANPIPPVEIWGGIFLTNDLYEIIGQSGIGKSRIMLDLALRQCLAGTWPETDVVTGEPIVPEFAGLPLYRGEVKWLLIGTENNIFRYHHDLKCMTKYCTPEQIDILGKRLFMMTLEGEGDTYIALDANEGADSENFKKLQAIIAQTMPDVVVFDPWGDVIGGSELDDRVVRDTIVTLRKLKQGIKDQMALIIVNHSRMGLAEAVKATGLDAANFGKNSKALYTIARGAWNLSYLENDLNSTKVALINSKFSYGVKYTSRAVCLNPDTMSYDTIPGIDVDEALRNLRLECSRPEQNRMEYRARENEEAEKRAIEEIKKALDSGKKTKTYLEAVLQRIGQPARKINSILAVLTEEQGYMSILDPYDKKMYFGTEKDISDYVDELSRIKCEKDAEKAAKQSIKRGRPCKIDPSKK